MGRRHSERRYLCWHAYLTYNYVRSEITLLILQAFMSVLVSPAWRRRGSTAFRQPPLRNGRVPLVALMGPAHFSISLFTNCPRLELARSSDTIIAPSPSRRSRTVGVFIASRAASCSLLTIQEQPPWVGRWHSKYTLRALAAPVQAQSAR
jgi:hypothetical protein